MRNLLRRRKLPAQQLGDGGAGGWRGIGLHDDGHGRNLAEHSEGQLGHLQLLRRDAGRGDGEPHRARRPGSSNRLDFIDQPLLHSARRRGHQLHRNNTDAARRAGPALAPVRATVCSPAMQASLASAAAVMALRDVCCPVAAASDRFRDDAGADRLDSWQPRPASCWQRWPPDAAIASTRTTSRFNRLHTRSPSPEPQPGRRETRWCTAPRCYAASAAVERSSVSLLRKVPSGAKAPLFLGCVRTG